VRRGTYYLDALLLSGFCSCLVAFVLYFTKGTGDWGYFIFPLLIPSILTLAGMLWVLSDKYGYRFKLPAALPIAIKAPLIAFIVVVAFFQLIVVAGSVMKFTNRYIPLLFHFWSYFMLAGFVCSIIILYRLTEPQKA
jgi:hypothetical protein